MVYITGDLHGDYSRFKRPELKKLRRGDILLVCGDFGFLWDGSRAEQKLLEKLGKQKYSVAFVDGVHENHRLLAEYPVGEWNGGKARRISGGLYHLMRGQVFRFGDTTVFTLGGGENPDADFLSGAMEGCMPTVEDLEEANRCLEAVDYRVDYIVTHDCPGAVKGFLNMDCTTFNHLHTFFDNAAKVIDYKRWYFGCYHIDKAVTPKCVGVFQELHTLG